MIHAKGNKLIKRVTHSALGLLGIQIILGAVTVWSGFSSHMKVIHLSVATLVWLSVILMSLVAEKSFSKNDLVNNVAEGKYA